MTSDKHIAETIQKFINNEQAQETFCLDSLIKKTIHHENVLELGKIAVS